MDSQGTDSILLSVEAEEKKPESPGVKNQVVGLLILLPVLGAFWFLAQFLPQFGDWLGGTVESAVVDDTPIEGAEAEVEKHDLEEEAVPEEKDPSAGGSFRDQIVEQLGGPDRAEVRHLAVSDDGSRMVVALKIFDEKGKGKLIELFFERDEFGRYLSEEDSPVETKITVWKDEAL